VGTLVVRRVEEDDSRYRRRAFKVLIDEEDVGRLKRGQSATFELSPGSHTVQVAIDWAGARRLDVSGDRDHTFWCGPGGDALPALLGINPFDAYLFLQPACEDCAEDDAEHRRRRRAAAEMAVALVVKPDNEDDAEDDAEELRRRRAAAARAAYAVFLKPDSEDAG
jgi:hypothetical protein